MPIPRHKERQHPVMDVVRKAIEPLREPAEPQELERRVHYFLAPVAAKNRVNAVTAAQLDHARYALATSLAGRDWVSAAARGKPLSSEAFTQLAKKHKKRLTDVLQPFYEHFAKVLRVNADTAPSTFHNVVRDVMNAYVHAVKEHYGIDASSALYRLVSRPFKGQGPDSVDGQPLVEQVVEPVPGLDKVETFESNDKIPESHLTDFRFVKSLAFYNYLRHGHFYTVPEQESGEHDAMPERNLLRRYLLGKEYHVFHAGSKNNPHVLGLGVYFSKPYEKRNTVTGRPHYTAAPLSALATALIQLAYHRKYGGKK